MMLDLHTHTTASDGTLSPEELVSLARERGLEALAITDHDSTEGLAAALEAARHSDLLLIPGVELSVGPCAGRDVHIIGYFVDHTDAALQARLHELRDARRSRAARIVGTLRADGYEIDLDDVLRLADCGSVGRSHVARVLVERGYAASVAEAFERFIGRGRPFYHPKPATVPGEVVRALADAGAIAVLAHPGVSGADDLIEDLVDAGLGGIEAFHAEHTEQESARYESLARSRGLLVTGGSDYHGPAAPGADLGSVPLPAYVLPELLAAAAQARTTR